MKIVILEDEAKTAADLKETLIQLDKSAEIVKIFDSVEASIDYFRENEMPDILFSDIQLADGLSFELFDAINITCPVIFCTAFDEYAIEAFRTKGIDYILKPFDEQSIRKSLEKVKQLEQHFTSQNHLLKTLGEALLQQKNYKTAFLISFQGKMIPVATSDIACFYIADEMVYLHTFSNKKYVTDYSLDEIEHMIDPKQYYRANRQFIIHFNAIVEVEPFFARKLAVKTNLHLPSSIVISKAKATDFLDWMENR
ncbi:LytR/AlgR family response regulator transcription factor [Microbacter margulisiae]|uniref:DNA-binding LytR/AlgR family response regulator n=1 Tax=Microbacter margulisiae TaxID=1350067 RepID=A0A7W5H3D7_9PORP|nr:LytTR family DNA-binding domain-containing protein [Microbacter margulisiae]MBB3188509.1 DNA-binding LytR/AlgR family response regulator [Microbacter margulisiae]